MGEYRRPAEANFARKAGLHGQCLSAKLPQVRLSLWPSQSWSWTRAWSPTCDDVNRKV